MIECSLEFREEKKFVGISMSNRLENVMYCQKHCEFVNSVQLVDEIEHLTLPPLLLSSLIRDQNLLCHTCVLRNWLIIHCIKLIRSFVSIWVWNSVFLFSIWEVASENWFASLRTHWFVSCQAQYSYKIVMITCNIRIGMRKCVTLHHLNTMKRTH